MENEPIWRRIARNGAIAIAGLLLLTALLPILDVDWWWVRIWDYPRLQLMFAYLVVATVVAALGWRNKPAIVVAGAMLVAAGWQLSWVYHYLPPAANQTQSAEADEPSRRIRVMTANVLMTNRSSEKLLEIIARADPDILVITEPDRWWAEALASLDADFPHSLKEPRDDTYGMILLSKNPFKGGKIEYLVEPTTPSMQAVFHLPSGERFRLFAVHPSPPRPGEDTDERDAELVIIGRRAKRSAIPAIVVGDLNDVGWSDNTRLFQEVSGLLDPRRGRGLYATFPADYPLLRYPLDHLFHSDEFRLASIEVLEEFGSDHLPVIFELSYEPEAADEQDAPDATAETRQEAEEQLDNVDRDAE